MNKTIIIAEAGVNHNGDIETAKRLIDVASLLKLYIKLKNLFYNLIAPTQMLFSELFGHNKEQDLRFSMFYLIIKIGL